MSGSERELRSEATQGGGTGAPVQLSAHSAMSGPGGVPAQAQSAALAAANLQMREAGAAAGAGDEGDDAHALAARGVSGGGQPLPHGDAIQASFGPHDVSGVDAHVGGPAAMAAQAMGAQAYATGHSVAFQSEPDLHLAAHEAAHVVQQRQGVSLKGGVGQSGDAYEQHADAVADAVVRGESAAGLLDAGPGGGGATTAVQRQDENTTHPQQTDQEGGDADEDAEPLTQAQRNALHTQLASRLNSAFTKYAIACEEVHDQLEAERAARVELMMTLVSVGFVFLTPGLGRAISSLANSIPQGSSTATYRVALTMINQADNIAGTMAELGKASAKSAVNAALANGTENYLAALSQGFSVMMDDIVGYVGSNVDNRDALPDADLWVYVSRWDPGQITQAGYERDLLAQARAFSRQVEPIGTPSIPELGGATNLGRDPGDRWHLYEEYGGGRYLLGASVERSMLDSALRRSYAEFGGPWAVRYVEDTMIPGGHVVPAYHREASRTTELRRRYAEYAEQ